MLKPAALFKFFFPEQESLEKFLKLQSEKIPSNLVESGYTNSNFIINFGPFLLIALFLVIVLSVAMLIILFVKKYSEKVKEKLLKFKDEMIWNGIIDAFQFVYIKL